MIWLQEDSRIEEPQGDVESDASDARQGPACDGDAEAQRNEDDDSLPGSPSETPGGEDNTASDELESDTACFSASEDEEEQVASPAEEEGQKAEAEQTDTESIAADVDAESPPEQGMVPHSSCHACINMGKVASAVICRHCRDVSHAKQQYTTDECLQ